MQRNSEKRFHCQHCGEKISKTLYYQHKEKYYSPATQTWSRDAKRQVLEFERQQDDDDEDFTFSDSADSMLQEGDLLW